MDSIRRGIVIASIASLTAACGPTYRTVWVKSDYTPETFRYHQNVCKLKAQETYSRVLASDDSGNNPSADGKAMERFSNQVNAGNMKRTAYDVCMTELGYRKTRRCTSNCN